MMFGAGVSSGSEVIFAWVEQSAVTVVLLWGDGGAGERSMFAGKKPIPQPVASQMIKHCSGGPSRPHY